MIGRVRPAWGRGGGFGEGKEGVSFVLVGGWMCILLHGGEVVTLFARGRESPCGEGVGVLLIVPSDRVDCR